MNFAEYIIVIAFICAIPIYLGIILVYVYIISMLTTEFINRKFEENFVGIKAGLIVPVLDRACSGCTPFFGKTVVFDTDKTWSKEIFGRLFYLSIRRYRPHRSFPYKINKIIKLSEHFKIEVLKIDGRDGTIVERYPLPTDAKALRSLWEGLPDRDHLVNIHVTSLYDGSYIESIDVANKLLNKGLSKIQKALDSEQAVAQIGFCEADQKWYGWSHRAMCGFGRGDRIFDKDYGDETTIFVLHGSKVIQTFEDAKLAASNFADYMD